MLTKVQTWGNGLALRIPKALAVDAHLENDSMVGVSFVEGQIIVTPVVPVEYSLDELLSGVTKDNIHREVDTGIAVEKEVW